MLANCRIQKYDPAVTEPPHTFITLGEVTVDAPEDDDGTLLYMNLHAACMRLGYSFRFYSLSLDPKYHFDIVVRGELENKLGIS